MADTLEIFGEEYPDATGIKATDENDNILIFYHATDGNNIDYGLTDGTQSIAGVAKVESATAQGGN